MEKLGRIYRFNCREGGGHCFLMATKNHQRPITGGINEFEKKKQLIVLSF